MTKQVKIVECNIELNVRNHMLFVGKTGSGKNQSLLTLLKNRHELNLPFEKLILFYNIDQPIYREYAKLFAKDKFYMFWRFFQCFKKRVKSISG